MGTLDRTPDLPGRKKERRGMLRPAPAAPEKDESEVRWLMSYSDFMMQLVCLFILLYSVSSVDTSKAVPLAQAWREEAGISEVRVSDSPRNLYTPLTFVELPAVLHEIQVAAGLHPGGGHLRIVRSPDGFRLQFVYEMFEAGSARLGRQGEALADVAALVLQPLQNRVASIEVVGHADAGEPDALPLSLTRARDAIRWMTRPEAPHRLSADSLRAAGRGAHDPSADNATGVGRALNRRVEFLVRLSPGP